MKPTLKLKQLIEGFEKFESKKKVWSVEQKKAALDQISKYNEYGKYLKREHNLMEIAETLSEIADAAEKFMLDGTEGTFDGATVKRNVAEMKKYSAEFGKIAGEAHVLEQRMDAFFEDMGHVLNRFFDIKDVQTECEDGRTKTVVSVEPKQIGERKHQFIRKINVF